MTLPSLRLQILTTIFSLCGLGLTLFTFVTNNKIPLTFVQYSAAGDPVTVTWTVPLFAIGLAMFIVPLIIIGASRLRG